MNVRYRLLRSPVSRRFRRMVRSLRTAPLFRQVFGLGGAASISLEASYSCGFPACQPVPAATPHAAFVPLYRCASVPDSHRVPFCRTSGVDTPCGTGKTQTLTAPETARQAKMEMMVCLASNFVWA